MGNLISIPVTDIREGGPVRHAIDARARARALRDDCVAWLPRPLQALLPALDAITRRWLARSASPYVTEIRSIAAALGFPGVWFLNGTYEWGCTALAREEAELPWLVRTLDWPFRGLGQHLEVARMRGPAGEFFNIAWPGYAGTLTASAPERFAAAINQAPLWRRTRHPWLRPIDVALNALRTWRVQFCPPAHLLRGVFETCRDFAEARDRLERTPIARPAIFTMVGTKSGERCVIERTEEGYVTHCDITAAANDWLRATPSWEARIATKLLLTCSYKDAAARSRARREALWSCQHGFGGDMAWLVPPVLNWFTRCAVEMCPSRGILRVAGYEPQSEIDLPLRVTEVCQISGQGL
ncbi:MAG TPA: hypothetical protein VH678_06215 [Xanthobacteraceae bacterium]|jgi:hypothetical protein